MVCSIYKKEFSSFLGLGSFAETSEFKDILLCICERISS